MPPRNLTNSSYHNRNSQDFPAILITTCRRPSPRIRTLSGDLSRLLPNSERLTRGKLGLKEIVARALRQGRSRLIVLERWKMGASKISFYSIGSQGLLLLLTIYVRRFVTHLERKQKGTRIPVVRAIGLLSEEESARRLSAFLSEFFGMKLMGQDEVEDAGRPVLTISVTRRGKVKLSVGVRDSLRNVPSLYVSRIVWDKEGVQV